MKNWYYVRQASARWAALLVAIAVAAGCATPQKPVVDTSFTGQIKAISIKRSHSSAIHLPKPDAQLLVRSAWGNSEIDISMLRYLVRNLNANGLQARYEGGSVASTGNVLSDPVFKLDIAFGSAVVRYQYQRPTHVVHLRYVARLHAPGRPTPILTFEGDLPTRTEPGQRIIPDDLTKNLVTYLREYRWIAPDAEVRYAD